MRRRSLPLPQLVAAAAGFAIPALAQVPAPEIFEPGIVSTAAPEFATALSPDGREVYFNRATADRASFPIFRSVSMNGRWQPAEPVAFAAEGRNPDPFIASDGSRIYFCSTRSRTPGGPDGALDIWYVDRTPGGWGPAINPGAPLNTEKNEVFVSATADGTLYFGSDRDGGARIYTSRPNRGGFDEPIALPESVTGGPASNPAISPDGQRLFFVADRPGGLGGADIYVVSRSGAGWSSPRNLGVGVNSPQADFAPSVTPDGRRLFFTSERPGIVGAPVSGRPPGDIYSIDIGRLDHR